MNGHMRFAKNSDDIIYVAIGFLWLFQHEKRIEKEKDELLTDEVDEAFKKLQGFFFKNKVGITVLHIIKLN